MLFGVITRTSWNMKYFDDWMSIYWNIIKSKTIIYTCRPYIVEAWRLIKIFIMKLNKVSHYDVNDPLNSHSGSSIGRCSIGRCSIDRSKRYIGTFCCECELFPLFITETMIKMKIIKVTRHFTLFFFIPV